MSINIDAVHRFNEETLVDPFDFLGSLRENEPIYYANDLNGWVITRHSDVADAFKEPNFISGNFETQVRNQLQGLNISIAKDFVRVRTKMMAHTDADVHKRLRRTCNISFGKKGLDTVSPIIKKAVDESVNLLPNDGEWDFATQFSEPLSTRVIADLFNVPYSDREHFQRCSDDVSRFFGNSVSDTRESAIIANDGIIALENYFIDFLKERKRKLGNDLLSLLIEANSAGLLSEKEVIAQCVLILMAGHYTVIDQLCNSIYAFLTYNEWQTLVNDPSLISSAIEESIRFDGAVLFMARTVKDSMLFRGKQLKANDTLFLGMGAANRDPEVFPSPDIFDIHRKKSRHLGFAYGPHQCIGMNLARVEMSMAFQALVKKYPNLKFSPNTTPKRKCESLFFRGFYSIKVKS